MRYRLVLGETSVDVRTIMAGWETGKDWARRYSEVIELLDTETVPHKVLLRWEERPCYETARVYV